MDSKEEISDLSEKLNKKLSDLLKIIVESQDDIVPTIVEDIIKCLCDIANFENPLDIKNCKFRYSDNNDALFYALSSILSKNLANFKILNAAARGMLYANNNEDAFDALCITATGGEKDSETSRTLYVTILMGILCSLFKPTIVQGNRAVTGCGCGGWAESDMMEFYRYPLFALRNEAKELLKKDNFFYANAKTYHPILRRFARARGIVGFRDIFKIASSLADPFRCKYQYLCVWQKTLLEPAAKVYGEQSHVQKAIVVSGESYGYDEFPITGGDYQLVIDSKIEKRNIKIEDQENLESGRNILGKENTLEEEALALRKIIDPDNGDPKYIEKRKLVVANAALGLQIVIGGEYKEMLSKVNDKINDGSALNQFNKCIGRYKDE